VSERKSERKNERKSERKSEREGESERERGVPSYRRGCHQLVCVPEAKM